MVKRLLENINNSPTAFHAVDTAESILKQNGFTALNERDAWKIDKGGKYYTVRGGSSLIAFAIGDEFFYNIAAAHTDSPCLKIKGNADMQTGNLGKLNVEVYGGPLLSTWFDRKLNICGRAYYNGKNGLECKLIKSESSVIIPSVAIHLNREANNGVKINPQTDMPPLTGIGKSSIKDLVGDALSYDLFLSCAEKGYVFGQNNDLIASPRLDDLQAVFGGLEAITQSNAAGINMLAILDNEEVGSSTRQGAGSTFLKDVMNRVAQSLNKSKEEIKRAYAASFLLSVDNAHAKHPNHPELSDPTNDTLLGGGIAVKNHANYNYTTDAYSAALIKKLFTDNNVKYQDFYSRSDIRCGGTLGAISSGRVSITAADIGLPQLAMHSAVETAATADYEELIKGLTAFYNSFKA